jgi:hypothetical protein
MSKAASIHAFNPDLGCAVIVPVRDLQRATPGALVGFLQEENALPAEDPVRPYVVYREGKVLNPSVPFAEQGVVGDVQIEIARKQIAQTPHAPR